MAKTTLVLLPGMDGTGTLFKPLIDTLGGRFRLVTVSYPADMPHGYAELEALAGATLPAEGPLILLGESFSGPIAIALAAARPSQIRGLILSCTFARNPRPLFSAFKWLVNFLPARPPMAIAGHFLFGRFATPELRGLLRQALEPVQPAVLRARLRAVPSIDATAALTRLRVPVLCLRASADRLVPASAALEIARLCPQARILTLPGPHCLLQAAPREAAHAIAEFIGAIGATDG